MTVIYCLLVAVAVSTASVYGDEYPVIQTKDGALRGFTMRTATGRPLHAFRRIPFAQAPLGPLRFSDPVKNFPWNGIRSAIGQSPQCVQLDMTRDLEVHGQEDCLFLNVYRPANSTGSLPVMVWIHGGGYFFGSGTIYGPAYLLDQDVILVTINHRLGPLGFFSTGDDASPGNQGMKDMVMSLQWVQDNIAAFGGDPNSVTVFGESAGAGAVHLLMMSPLSRGLFHKAITHSGAGSCWWAITEDLVDRSKKAAQALNCPTNSSQNMMSCLRALSPQDVVGVISDLWEWNTFPTIMFGPVVEHNHPGAFLVETVEQAYAGNRVMAIPWMNGFTQNEFAWITSSFLLDDSAVSDLNTDWDRVAPIFLKQEESQSENIARARAIRQFYMGTDQFSFETRHAFSEMFSDRYIITGGLESMRLHSKLTKAPTYGYRLTHQGKYSVVQATGWEPKDWGVVHLDDLIYLMDNPDYYGTITPSDDDFEMVQMMTSLWVSFAKDGQPNLSTWRPVQAEETDFFPVALLDLNLSPVMLDNYYADRENFWIGLNQNRTQV